MVEIPDVSSSGFPRNKTRMERTPKPNVSSNTRCVSGLVLNLEEMLFFL